MTDVRKKIVSILADKLGVEEERVKEETSFTDLGADSLDKLDIIMDLEEAFGVEVMDVDVRQIETVGDIFKEMDRLLQEKAA